MIRRAGALALLAAALLPLAARAQTITAAPGGEMSSLVGVPFDVPIYVDLSQRTDRLGSFALRMTWDTTVLKLIGGGEGTFGAVTLNRDSTAYGILRMSGANPAGAGGLVTVGIGQFVPLVAQPDTLRLAVSELFAAVTFADLTPSLVVHNAAFCPAIGMFGDIDKDGAINSRDALIALSNAVGLDVSAYTIALGDVDASGTTTARDALIILTYSVGLPATGYRVNRIDGGSCATNLPLVMSIVPDTVDLMVGQTVALEARAADSAGVLQTVTDAIWKTSNAEALAVFSDGRAEARDTGTVVVTATRGTLDSARATVRIVAHRRLQIVDAAAVAAKNQLGSAAFPFAKIAQATGIVADGDTIEVRAGRYAEAVQLAHSVVVVGDTLPDGTRPLIVADTVGDTVGIALLGPLSQEVHNLTLQGFYDGVDVVGARRARLAGLRMSNVYNGVVVVDTTDLLRIENSRIVGAGVSSAGYGVLTGASVDTLVIAGSEIGDFGYDGLFAAYADSVAVLGSHIHDVGENGIYAAPPVCEVCDFGGGGLSGNPGALVVDSSTVERGGNFYYLVDVESFRSASITHSRLLNPVSAYNYGLYLRNGGVAQLVGDSMSSAYDWLDAWVVASLRVDSSRVFAPYAAASLDSVPVVAISHTQLFGLQVATAVFDTVPGGGGQLTLHDVAVTGDPGCGFCTTAFHVSGATAVADSLAFQNLAFGLYSFMDSGLVVTNSRFQSVENPIFWDGSSGAGASQVRVANSTFSGFSGNAIYAAGFGVAVDSNTFLGGPGASLYFWDAWAPMWITRNRFVAVETAISAWRGGGSGADADSIADNVITGPPYNAIVIQDSVSPAHVRRNTVGCTAPGGESSSTGIDLQYGDGVVADNQVTGCTFGIYAYSYGQPHTVSMTGNAVTLPAYSYAGLYAYGPLSATLTGNAITGDTTGSAYDGGIYLYNPGSASGSSLIYGNAVRRVGGTGIYLQNQDTLQVLVDSNVVDSTAGNGIQVASGPVAITRARIVGSRQNGVLLPYSAADTADVSVRHSFIAGNTFGVQGNGYAFHADSNWWGDANGPHYAGDQLPSAGDSVSAGLLFQPFLADTTTLTVPMAPRVIAQAVLRIPALGAAVMAGPAAAAAARTARSVTPPPAAPSRGAAPLRQVDRPPRRVSPARLQAWQRMAEYRTAEAGALERRHSTLAAAQAAQSAAREARERRMEQRQAEQAALFKAQREEAASLRAARQGSRP